MTDTCGLTSCEPFAKWDHDSQCWKTSEATSLWALTLSSLTLPTWGGLHDGELCEHPTPAPVTSGHDCSSLPTPNAADGKRYNLTHQRGEGNPTLLGAVHHLPTPTVDDSKQVTRASGAYQSLTRSVAMLPTPRAQDEYERRNMKTMERIRDEGGDMTLPTWAKVVAPLLPTPNCMDSMGTRSDEALARAKKNGGCANLKDVIPRMLPTPTTQHSSGGYNPEWGHGMTLLDAAKDIVEWTGPTTRQPFTDGKPSQDDARQHQLSLDELAHPA